MLIFFLIALGANLWGKQWHMAGFIASVCVCLGIAELWCKLQTGHTLSQWHIIWSQDSYRDFILSWVMVISLLMALVMLSHHLK